MSTRDKWYLVEGFCFYYFMLSYDMILDFFFIIRNTSKVRTSSLGCLMIDTRIFIFRKSG